MVESKVEAGTKTRHFCRFMTTPLLSLNPQKTTQHLAVIFPHRQVQVNIQSAAFYPCTLFHTRIQALLVIRLPIGPNPPFLPIGQIVKIDPALKQEFIFLRHTQVFEPPGSLGAVQLLLAQTPVAVGVEGIAVCVFVAPTKIVKT